MKITKIGSGDKKILLIHGWMHSSKRYMKFAEEIGNDCEVSLVDLPGFGEEEVEDYILKEKSLLNYFRDEVIDLLNNENFDIIIGHSLGGNLILRALAKMKYKFEGRIVLFNPCYNGIDALKPILSLTKLNRTLFSFKNRFPKKVVKPFIKVLALITINDWKLIDDIIINDTIMANPYVSEKLMEELVFDEWRIRKKIKNITIVESENDRLIKEKKIEILKSDVDSKVVKLKDIGHTPILEDYDNFVRIVKEELNKVL